MGTDSTIEEIPLTIEDASKRLGRGEISSLDLTKVALSRADRLDSLLGVYLKRFDDTAIAQAKAADKEIADGTNRGPLHGIPVAIKDIIATREAPTTAQSLVLDPEWGAERDAPVVTRLREAGAIIVGKTTTMEFAFGMPDPTKPFPLPRNPWDLKRWPGGSSSGTGSGVAAGLFLAGLGTDTGGSIRCPAAHSGVSGLKPTFGRVPKSGLVPLGYNTDNIGPLARSAWDCAAMLQALAGFHESDPDSARVPVPDYLTDLRLDLEGVRVGVARDHHFPPSCDPALAPRFEAAVTQLGELGAIVTDVSLPYWEELYAATYLTWQAETLAYHRQDLQRRWSDYSVGVRTVAALGALGSAADYVQAQRVRRACQRRVGELFREVDLVVSPAMGTGALRYSETGELEADELQVILDTAFTWYWNGVGNPAIAIPMGFSGDGLPLALQIAGRPFEESLVLSAGVSYQSATDWHLRVPSIGDEEIGATDGE